MSNRTRLMVPSGSSVTTPHGRPTRQELTVLTPTLPTHVSLIDRGFATCAIPSASDIRVA